MNTDDRPLTAKEHEYWLQEQEREERRECERCRGSGEVWAGPPLARVHRCGVCHGTGKTTVTLYDPGVDLVEIAQRESAVSESHINEIVGSE